MPKRAKSSIVMGELSKKKHAVSTAARVSLDTDMRASVDDTQVVTTSSGEKIVECIT